MGANSSKVVPSSSKPRHQPQTQERLLGRNKKALHAAAKAGDAAQLEQLLQPLVTAVTAEMAVPGVYPGPAAAVLGTAVGWRDRHGRTPFLEACLHGSWECAELLLEAGSNIVAVDAAGNGCLHLASIKGHGHVLDQLLSKAEVQGIAGRLVNTTNRFGFSALHYAAWSGHAHIVRKLLMSTSASDRLMLQACTDNYDKWLIVSQGSTALHVAALQQHASVVLAIMQHYALLLRDWLPVDSNSRRPVDPRTWPDAQGATPLHVALWRGLDRSSQLAALLHPRTDVTTLFDLHQLEDLRRRGPPTLQVLAAAALRSELLRQLQQQQALLQEQRQIEALQAAARARQRQRARQQEKQRQREQIGQRWWGRGSADAKPTEALPAASLVPTSEDVATNSSSGSNAARGPTKQGQQQQTTGQSTAQQQEDLSPWHELCRTPSITLGAMQQYSSAGDEHEHAHVPHSKVAGQHNVLGQGIISTEMQLPGPAGVQSRPKTAAAAGPATDTSEGVQQKQLLSASSITLGVLDRIWLASDQSAQQQHQQQQQQDVSAAPSTPEVTAESGKVAIGSSDSSSGGSSTGDNSTSSRSGDVQPGTVAITADTAATTAATGTESAVLQQQQQQQQQHYDSSSDLAVIPVSEHAGDSPGIQHLYKGVGSVSAFQLVGPPVACSTDIALYSTQSQADDTAGSAAAAAAAADTQPAGSAAEQHAGVSRPSSAAGRLTAVCQQAAAPPLATMSITLGQLPGLQQQQQQQQQQKQQQQQQQQDASSASPGPSRYPTTQAAGGGRSPMKQSVGLRLVRQSSSSRLQPLLSTAGIKQADLDQALTPLAWKLLQQQHQAQRIANSKQQMIDMVSATAPEQQPMRQEVCAAQDRNEHRQQQRQQQQQQRFPRSPHRRSFDLPGASSSMSGLLGATRQHVDHMRSQAADMNKCSLLGLHTGGQSLLAGGGASSSRRSSLDKTGLTLEVATSLAGALPGCVSETLTQYLQVYTPRSGATAGTCCHSVGCEGRACGCASHDYGVDAVQGNVASPRLSSESGLHEAGFSRRGSSNNQRRSLSLFGRYSSDKQGVSEGSHAPTSTETCAVCMDEPCAVALTGCSHSLCFTCAGCIVGQGVGVRPPLCPFCRTAIRGLHLAALQVG